MQLFFVYFFRRNTLEFIFIVYTLDVVVCGYPTPFKFHPLMVQIPFFWMAKHIILYSLGNCQPTCSYFFVYFQFFTNINLNLFSLLMPLMLWYVVYPTPFKFHPLFVQISFFYDLDYWYLIIHLISEFLFQTVLTQIPSLMVTSQFPAAWNRAFDGFPLKKCLAIWICSGSDTKISV